MTDGRLSLRGTTNWEVLAALRFVLAGIVLSTHLPMFVSGSVRWAEALRQLSGKAAVVGFLIVSGYSISASLSRDREGFYRRRFLRIYPLYAFTLVVGTVLEHLARGPIGVPPNTFVGRDWLTTIGNFLFLQTFLVKPVVFAGVVWSLAIEVFYYVCAPLFARLSRRTLITMIVVSGLIFVLPKRDELGLPYMFLRLNAFRYLWCWLLGFMLERHRDRLVELLSVAAVAVVIFGEATTEPLAFLTYLVSLVLVLEARRVALPRSLRGAADYLGDLSYPLYLLHLPVFIFGYGFLGLRTPLPLVALVVVVTLFAFHVIDRALKRRVLAPLILGRRAPAAYPAVSVDTSPG